MNKIPKFIRLFPEDKPYQTVKHIIFRLAPVGVEVIAQSSLNSDGTPEASVKIGVVRGMHRVREVEEIIAMLLKILRGSCDMDIQIDSEGYPFQVESIQ